jgi:D-3-phosphoglycerate dehydrogenase
MINVLYLGPAGYEALLQEELGASFRLVRVPAELPAVERQVKDAGVWFDASMKVPLGGTLLAQAEQLKLVITATTGADHIDQKALEARGIPLLTLRGQTDVLHSLTPAAELSWLLLMACARKLRSAIHHVEQGLWDREQFPGTMLKGKRLGLIGCGRIGTWMSRYARGFDMETVGYDPYLARLPETITPVSLEALLSSSHFISIHVPFNEQTRNLIGKEQFALMRKGAVLINSSRGAIVNEEALLAGLEAGTPAALGVDVVDGEPDIQRTRLWQYAQTHHNVVITPHIGGFSPDALEVVLRHTARRIVQHFA